MPDFTESNNELESNYQNQKNIELHLTNWRAIKLGIMIGLIPSALVFVYYSFVLDVFYGLVLVLVSLAPLGIPGGIIGALLFNRWKKTRGAALVGAILGTIVVAVILYGFLSRFGSPFGLSG